MSSVAARKTCDVCSSTTHGCWTRAPFSPYVPATQPRLPGPCTVIDGHVAYVPLLVHRGSRYARPNDLLPLKGSTVTAQLLKDLTNTAHKLGANLPPIFLMLPRSLWPETGAELREVEQYA